MKLSELFYNVETCDITSDIASYEVMGIASDSRRVEKGYVFVCLRGTRSDGHDHIAEAMACGALLAVVEKDWSGQSALPTIRVDSTRSALAHLWNNFCGRPTEKLDIIAVTGTNGKTSVTYLLREIFSCAGYKTGLIGTVNCFVGDRDISELKRDESLGELSNMTTPDPESLYKILAVMADEGTEVVFMEATSHALALSKPDAINFKLGLFTNLTPEHLDFHGDMENYFFAKRKLFSMCERGIINIDDAYAKRLLENVKIKLYTASTKKSDADFFADEIKDNGVDGIEYLFDSKDSVFRIKSPIPGSFTVKNTLLAAACAHLYGVDPMIIQDSLKSFCGVIGRMERVPCERDDIAVFIDYAHTPDALENLLSSVRSFCTDKERITLVFGCGGDRDVTKRPMMGAIASKYADRVIVTSDNPRSEDSVKIIFDILSGVDKTKPYVAISDRRDAIEYAVLSAVVGEVVILAGKGHEKYQIKEDKRIDFDEREMVRLAAQKACHTK